MRYELVGPYGNVLYTTNALDLAEHYAASRAAIGCVVTIRMVG